MGRSTIRLQRSTRIRRVPMIMLIPAYLLVNPVSGLSPRTARSLLRTTCPLKLTVPWASSSSALFSQASRTSTYESIFDIQVPEGRCVGVRMLSDMENDPRLWEHLHHDEIRYGQTLGNTRPSFWLGRLAMRQALGNEEQLLSHSILKDEYGRPIVPSGFVGSISHKRDTGVALVGLVAQSQPSLSVGVDLEEIKATKMKIERRILTEHERQELGKVRNLTVPEEIVLRFSIKESLYKAIHPLLCRPQYVGFQEAQVQPFADGSAAVTLQLKNNLQSDIDRVTAHWQRLGDFFVTTASIQLVEGVSCIEGPDGTAIFEL